MDESENSVRWDRALDGGLLAFAFSFVRCRYFWPAILFLLLAVASVAWSRYPAISAGRVKRLLLISIVFMVGMPPVKGSFDPAGRAVRLAWAFLFGVLALGVLDAVRVPWFVWRGGDLYDAGNMRDPQFYTAALCLLAAAWNLRAYPGRRGGLALALGIAAMGLLLHFKRGAWLSALLAVSAVGFFSGRRRIVGVAVLCVAALFVLPQSRDRIAQLSHEWSRTEGGRYTLWTCVAPVAIRKFPQGVGYGAVKHADYRFLYSGYVQPTLNHMHNNLLQVAVELGWAGVGLWVWWMGAALWIMARSWRRLRSLRDPCAWLALGVLGAFCGLLLNGVVEYNFGDSEILMLFFFLMGLSCLLDRRGREADGLAA